VPQALVRLRFNEYVPELLNRIVGVVDCADVPEINWESNTESPGQVVEVFVTIQFVVVVLQPPGMVEVLLGVTIKGPQPKVGLAVN